MKENTAKHIKIMKRTLFFIAGLMLTSAVATAQEKTEITELNLAGPYAVAAPMGIDTVDVNGKKFDESSLLGGLSLSARPTQVLRGGILPSLQDSKSVGVLSFYINNFSNYHHHRNYNSIYYSNNYSNFHTNI